MGSQSGADGIGLSHRTASPYRRRTGAPPHMQQRIDRIQKAPEGELPAPERPGSLQYHAPSWLSDRFAGHRGRTRVLARLLARAEPYPQ